MSDHRLETILVVDDNAQNRAVARGHLAAAGYAVELADGGQAALAAVEGAPPDLILLDILMPGMDGFETCRRLRARPGGDAVPIVFLTALGDLETHQHAIDAGADDFLSKPINRVELLLRVRSLVRLKRLQEELVRGVELIRTQRDALVAAQRRREELTGLIVHDLKSPLASAIANVRFALGEAGVGQEVREALGDVLTAGMAMNRMIMNLLDIGRSEDGALVPRPEAVAVRALLDEVGAEAARRAADRGQRLVIESEALEVRADRDLLRRVLENLVDNSLRYSPEGSTVRLEARADAGAAELRVRDDGLGVPAAYRERIFEKYVTLDPASSAEVRSSRGLGLVFCRLAVEAHGGRIWVEDNHPRGSTFCVRLPAGG